MKSKTSHMFSDVELVQCVGAIHAEKWLYTVEMPTGMDEFTKFMTLNSELTGDCF